MFNIRIFVDLPDSSTEQLIIFLSYPLLSLYYQSITIYKYKHILINTNKNRLVFANYGTYYLYLYIFKTSVCMVNHI